MNTDAIDTDRNEDRMHMSARATGVVSPADLMEFLRTERSGRYAHQLLFDARSATTRVRWGDVQMAVDV